MNTIHNEKLNLYNELKAELTNLPDEMTRDFEMKLTNLMMNPKYADEIAFIEKMIEEESDEEIAYALFLMCGIYYRRSKDHGKQERLFHLYTRQFEHRRSFQHYRTLSYVDTGYNHDWREIFAVAKDNSLNMNQSGAHHLFAEIVAMTFEEEHDASEAEFKYWLNEALHAVDIAIIASNGYAKFYCTKGRIYSLLNKADEAQMYIRMAIEKEDSSKKDYTLRIGNYQYYLLKVQSRYDRVQLKTSIDHHKTEIEQSILEVNEKADMIDKSLMRNLEYLGIFSGIISFTMGSINIASSLAEVSFLGAAGLIVVLFGALVGVFGMFDLIIHGYRKENNTMYCIVLFIVLLALLGGFKICSLL